MRERPVLEEAPVESTTSEPVTREFQVVIDCRDPAAMAAFWADALGYRLDDPPGEHTDWMAYQVAAGFPASDRVEFAAISDPRWHRSGGGRLCFMGVPEPKTSKNRLHLDIQATDRGDNVAEKARKVDALVDRLTGRGGTAERTGRERGQYYVVMTDPEGHEFCVH